MSTKKELILKYRTQLNSFSDQELIIPELHEYGFWEWFEKRSRIYNYKRIRKNLYMTSIPIVGNNFCFKNSFRIAKGFVKRLYYFEGFTYDSSTENCIRHAFNVCKHDTVLDYSLNGKPESTQDFYIGVKIPLNFAKKIYHLKGDAKYTQYSLLVPYFMFSNGIENFAVL